MLLPNYDLIPIVSLLIINLWKVKTLLLKLYFLLGMATKCTAGDGCSCIPIGKCRQCSRLDLVCSCSGYYAEFFVRGGKL